MTSDTTSAGMPPIAANHGALDVPPMTAHSSDTAAIAGRGVQSLVGEGKAQVSSTLGGLAEAVREIATKLEGNGAGPVAKYIHEAADTVSGWSHAVESKSVDELIGDTRTLVRTSPAIAVSLAVGAGFIVSRVVRSGR